jgi:hypothetical protein
MVKAASETERETHFSSKTGAQNTKARHAQKKLALSHILFMPLLEGALFCISVPEMPRIYEPPIE